MVIKDFADWRGTNDTYIDRNFVTELRNNKLKYKEWTSKNGNALVYADLFSDAGRGKVYHDIFDSYDNIIKLCNEKNWKFILTGVDSRWSHACREIWNEM